MAAPRKPTLPADERKAVQAHFREALLGIGVTQSDWAHFIAALSPSKAKTKYERERENTQRRKKNHDFIRTHLKAHDPHFTYETAEKLMDWFLRLLYRKLDTAKDGSAVDAGCTGTYGKWWKRLQAWHPDGRVEKGPYVAEYDWLQLLLSEWPSYVYKSAPSFGTWMDRQRIEILMTPEGANRLAKLLATELGLRDLIDKRSAGDAETYIRSAIHRRGRTMCEDFSLAWTTRIQNYYVFRLDQPGLFLGSLEIADIFNAVREVAWPSADADIGHASPQARVADP